MGTKKIIFFKKTVAVILFMTIFAQFFSGIIFLKPKIVHAVIYVPVDCTGPVCVAENTAERADDTINTALNTEEHVSRWTKWGLNAALQIFLTKILQMLTNDIVSWIQGDGKPKFVTDWRQFLIDAADAAGGQFIDEILGANFLCSPFRPQIAAALRVPKFDERTACKISDILQNYQNFADDFSGGGWEQYVRMNVFENTLQGQIILANEEKLKKEQEAAQAALNEAISSGGFLAAKDALGKIQTPGAITKALGEKIFTKDIEIQTQRLGGLDLGPISSYIMPIIDAAVSRVMKEGLAALSQSGPSSQNPGGSLPPSYDTAPRVDISPSENYSKKSLLESYIDQETKILSNENIILNTKKSIQNTLAQLVPVLQSINDMCQNGTVSFDSFSYFQDIQKKNEICANYPQSKTTETQDNLIKTTNEVNNVLPSEITSVQNNISYAQLILNKIVERYALYIKSDKTQAEIEKMNNLALSAEEQQFVDNIQKIINSRLQTLISTTIDSNPNSTLNEEKTNIQLELTQALLDKTTLEAIFENY